MDFHRAWKSFLKEDIDLELQLLIESKFKDARKKFKELDEWGYVEDLKRLITDRLGPRAIPKYIMWAAKQLDIQRTQENAAHSFLQSQALVIADALGFFENNQDRMPEKDINKYKTLASLVADVRTVGPSASELKKQEKETAVEGSEIVYDQDDIFAVRPYTEGASCYYGKNTRWCISATDTKNYFDQYTSDRKAFVMARLNNIPEDAPERRFALVYDDHGDLEEVYDATDLEVGLDVLRTAVEKNNRGTSDSDDIYEELVDSGAANVANNPPDPSAGFEAQAEKVEEEYRDSIKHAWYSYDIDEYMYFNGGFEFEFDLDRFEDAEYQLPNYFSDRELEDALREEGNLYGIDEVDITETGGTVDIRVHLNAQDYEPNPDGYDSFLSELSTMDDNYVDLKRIVEKYLVKEGYMMPSAFDAASEELTEFASTLKNYELASDLSSEDRMVFTNSSVIPLDLPEGRDSMGTLGHGGMFNKLDIKISGNPTRRPAYPGNNEFLKRLMKDLQGLNRQLMILMQKQLQLPIDDLPPRVIEELSIPDNLVVTFHGDHTGMNRTITARVAFSLDPEVTREVIDASMAAIKFMDQSYKGIEKAISNVLTEMWREWEANRAKADAAKKELDNLPDGTIPATLGDPQPAQEGALAQELLEYFGGVSEEKGRSRQRGIYKFYCMVGYNITTGDFQRGLDDILADIRALPNVTIVTVVIGNRRITEESYIAGLSVKFIPSIPGQFANPESVKSTIVRGVKKVKNIQRIFKISSSLERVE